MNHTVGGIQMKAEAMNLLQWQERFGTGEACAEALKQQCWPNGFQCPECGHDQEHWIGSRKVCQCGRCRYQSSVTAGTLFHSSNVALVQWFLAICLMACDKGGISALRLSRQIGVSWITAHRMPRKMRHAMVDRDSICRLGGWQRSTTLSSEEKGLEAGVAGVQKEKHRCWQPSEVGAKRPGSSPWRQRHRCL
jgi:hypothetical protein